MKYLNLTSNPFENHLKRREVIIGLGWTHLVGLGLQERRYSGPDAVLDAPDGALGAAYSVRGGCGLAPGERVVRRLGGGGGHGCRVHFVEHVLVHVKAVVLVSVVHVDDALGGGRHCGRVAVAPLLDVDDRRQRRRRRRRTFRQLFDDRGHDGGGHDSGRRTGLRGRRSRAFVIGRDRRDDGTGADGHDRPSRRHRFDGRLGIRRAARQRVATARPVVALVPAAARVQVAARAAVQRRSVSRRHRPFVVIVVVHFRVVPAEHERVHASDVYLDRAGPAAHLAARPVVPFGAITAASAVDHHRVYSDFHHVTVGLEDRRTAATAAVHSCFQTATGLGRQRRRNFLLYDGFQHNYGSR